MIVFQVGAERLKQEYYAKPSEAIHRSMSWYTETGFLKIYLTIGSSMFYYTVDLAELPESIRALLNREERVIGVLSEDEEEVEHVHTYQG
jgi:hypothetical protein